MQFYDDHYENPVTDNEYISKHSDELFFDGSNDAWYKTQIYKAIFLRDGKWYCLYGDWRYNDKYWEKNSYQRFGTEMKAQTLNSYFDEAGGNITQLKTDFFRPVEFIRKEYHHRRNTSPFSPTGGFGSPNFWRGIGFIDIVLNSDTLKIKMDMEEISAKNKSYSFSPDYPDIQIFNDEKIDFFILLNGCNIYLIKPK